MILTGQAIRAAVDDSLITIDPFEPSQVNPNSYNYRLGHQITEVRITPGGAVEHHPIELEQGRAHLRRRRLYLGHTMERIGSEIFVTSLIGRSSIGRLGLFVQVSANLGHQGAIHRWTLELYPVMDIVLYPGQLLGQVSFWRPVGARPPTHSHPGATRPGGFNAPQRPPER